MLDHLGMVGVSWRQGATESLAEFTLREDEVAERLAAFAEEQALREIAYLATCNRVELIFARTDRTPGRDLRRAAFRLLTGRAPEPGEAERRLRAWEGEGAAEHLFLIAAGLDSACVGETEIVGQVRVAYERAAALGLVGPALDIVFDEALKIAARVRGTTRLAEGRVSLAEIAVDLIRERLAATEGTVALIGVSPMTERAALALAPSRTPLLVVNRTAAKAEALAARFSIEHESLAAFVASPPPVEAVLCATGAPHAVLTEAVLARLAAAAPSGRPPLIVDMAIPADADPAACAKLGIPRIGMDEIVHRAETNRNARLMHAADAREQVDRALHGLQDRFAERFYGPLFATLQQRYRTTAQEGVKRLLKKQLKGLGTEERAAIEAWTEALARRLAHIPCLGLRGLLYGGPEGSVEAFLNGLDGEFAEELRDALERGSAGPSAHGPSARGPSAHGPSAHNERGRAPAPAAYDEAEGR
jgi:glutamyl-tRNA reductase